MAVTVSCFQTRTSPGPRDPETLSSSSSSSSSTYGSSDDGSSAGSSSSSSYISKSTSRTTSTYSTTTTTTTTTQQMKKPGMGCGCLQRGAPTPVQEVDDDASTDQSSSSSQCSCSECTDSRPGSRPAVRSSGPTGRSSSRPGGSRRASEKGVSTAGVVPMAGSYGAPMSVGQSHGAGYSTGYGGGSYGGGSYGPTGGVTAGETGTGAGYEESYMMDAGEAQKQLDLTAYSDGFSEESEDDSKDYEYSTGDILEKAKAGECGVVSAPPNASMAYEVQREFTPYIRLGPIIGMVTETTARILVEVSENCEVKSYATDANGTQHGVSLSCIGGRPMVFIFEELEPGTQYKVTFDIPVPGLVHSGFKTLASDWTLKEKPAKIAVVSSNDYLTNRDVVTHQQDLWKKLYNENKKEPFDYCLHLGNNVFVDSKDYIDTKVDGRIPSDANVSAFQDALDFASGLSGDLLRQAEAVIVQKIRDVYYDTWNHPTVRHAMANMPNLMICGPMDLGQSFYPEDDTDTARQFVMRCAYKVYNEYCRSLFEDVTGLQGDGRPLKIGQAYHFHALGDVGIVFIDTKAHHNFHRSRHADNEIPFLGKRQWNDIDYALAENGYLSYCKVLLVCTATPVAQISEAGWLASSNNAKLDLAETFNTPPAVSEASLLLSKLFDWKNRKQGARDFMLLAGSVTDGGLTVIADNRYETGVDKAYQVTAGQIAGSKFTGPAALSSAGSNRGIGVYHTFTHQSVLKSRCFATVRIARDSELDMVTMSASHIVDKGQSPVVVKHKM